MEALAGVEEQLYVSLDGILGRNVKRVQDGLKRVREAMETEDRSITKDDFSTLDKKRKWIRCVLCCVCVCACVCVCRCFRVSSPIPTSHTAIPHTTHT